MTQLDRLIEKIKLLSTDSIAQLDNFVGYLQWQEQKATRTTSVDWTFDFIEHFSKATKLPANTKRGAEIKIGPAICNGIERAAIYAHPPVQGQSIIEYYVPIPQDISHLILKLAIGIRDGSELVDPNLVAFSVRLNGYRVWGAQTNAHRWQTHEVDLATPTGDISKIEFVTEALGDHQWTWAVWGNPLMAGTRVV
jgi:hypothetical protein